MSGQRVELEFGLVNSGRVEFFHQREKVVLAIMGCFKLQLAAKADAQFSSRAKSRHVCLGQGIEFQVTLNKFLYT